MRYEDASQTGSAGSDVTARDDSEHLAGNDFGPATGNIITGTGTVSGAAGTDMAGAGAQITAIAGAGGSDTSFDASGQLQVAGRYGTLTIDANGNYTYVRNPDSPDAVSDTFTYTLANSAGATDTANLVVNIGDIPMLQAQGNQTVQTANGVVVLPAGVDLSDVRVVGRDLVITLPDGTTMVIPDGAIFVPQLVVDGVEVPATNLAALLIDSEPKPAAGDTSPTTLSSGGNFGVPVQPLDPGVPLGDLIPPTELFYTPPEVEELYDQFDSEPPVITPSAINVSEEGVSSIAPPNPDNTGSPDTTNLRIVNGHITVVDPDGDPFTVSLGAPSTSLFSQGVAIAWSVSLDGHTVTGSAGSNTVVTLVIDNDGNYTVTLSRPVDHPTGGGEQGISFVVPVFASDSDGSANPSSITVTIEDDSPTIEGRVSEPNLVVDDTTFNINDTDSVSGAFAVSYGADGPAASNPISYAMGINAGSTGLFDTLTGSQVVLTVESGVVVGRAGAGGPVVFTVSVDGSGNVTLDQSRAVVHNDPADPVESGSSAASLAADNLVTVSIIATDRDGDQASIAVNIGQNLRFEDDGPSVSLTSTSEPQLTVDDSTLGTNASASFAGMFAPVFGNDGPAAGGGVAYALSVTGGPSGIVDVATGEAVNLVINGAVVEGRSAGTNQLVFTVSVNGSGVVTLDQIRAVQHNDPADPVESGGSAAGLTLDSLVRLTATVTDGDGDSATASVNIGSNLHFEDDGPSIGANGTQPILAVDETVLASDASASFAGIFSPNFGADGAAAVDSVAYALGVSAPGGVPSGLVDSLSGHAVFLFLEGGQVVGREGTSAGDAATGDIVFTVGVDGSGLVTLDQQRAVIHDDLADPDESSSPATLSADNLVTLTATVTDRDGDTATATANIGQNLAFEDDGPSVTIEAAEEPQLIVDETNLPANIGPVSFIDSFNLDFGEDGPASSNSQSFSLSITEGPTGLVDTATGNQVFLFLETGQVVGREGTSALDAASGDIVFTVSVNATGDVSLNQLRAVVHGDPTDPDEADTPARLSADDLIRLNIVVADADGDTASASVNIARNLEFRDDGPDAVDDTVNQLGENQPVTFSVFGNDVFGADGVDTDNSPVVRVTFTQPPAGQGTISYNAVTGEFTFTPAPGQTGSTSFTYTIIDGDGDPDTATVTINLADDSSPVPVAVTAAVDDDGLAGPPAGNPASTIGDIDANAGETIPPGSSSEAVFVGQINVNFGVDTGFVDFSNLHNTTQSVGTELVRYSWNGATDVLTATVDAGGRAGTVLFTVQLTPSGTYTVTLVDNVIHAAGGNEASAPAVVLNYHAEDSEGDFSNAGTLTITFNDDAPTVSVTTATEPVLVVDDSTLGTNASASFAGLFNPVFGADGAGPGGGIAYGLSVTGGPSGIVDVATGEAVNLVMNGAVVEGRSAVTNQLVFTVTVNGSGLVTLDQIRAVQHNDPADHDEPGASAATLTLDTLVKLTATATDGDGDSASVSVDIGSNLQFKDDGPSVSITTATEPVLVVDDSTLGTNASASFAGLFNPVFGADGAGPGGGIAYGLSIVAGPSGIIDVATGEAVNLVMNGAVVEGRSAVTNQLVFTIGVNGSGVVTLDQIRAVQHNDPADHDEPGASAATLTLDTLVKLTATVTDKDLDTATATVDIGSNMQFKDDGPSVIASGAEPLLTVDDTTLGTNASASFAGLFIPTFGADGAGAGGGIGYALAITAGPSGIVDVATGQAVNLVMNGSTVEGRTAISNQLVFTVTVDGSGLVTLDQLRAVQHNDPADPVESGLSAATLGLDSLIRLTATVTDKDGDTATATVNIGTNLRFEDDGPALGVVQSQQTDNSIATPPAVGTLHFTSGADGAGSTMTITANVAGIKSGGFNLVTQQVGNVLTAYQDADGDGIKDAGETTAVFTLTVNPSAGTSGQYVFDLMTPLTPTVTPFNIGSGSSFGVGPSQEVVVTDNNSGLKLVYVTGWGATGGFTPAEHTAWLGGAEPDMTQTNNVNGSTSGWGLGNNNFDSPEFMRFDFGALDDYDAPTAPDGIYEPPGTPTIETVTFATFSFFNFGSGDTIEFVAHYENGTSQSFVLSDGSVSGLTITAPAGTNIAWIDAYQASGSIKLNLDQVGVITSSLDVTIPFTLQLTDGDGDSTTTNNFSVHVAPGLVPFAPAAPVVLDTNGDGTVSFLDHSAGVAYDYGNDGHAEGTAWAAPGDSILVRDANGNGSVDGASEFVFGGNGQTDLEALHAQYGEQLDASDADFTMFAVWNDANSNGVVDGNEMQSLAEAGIASIGLVSDGIAYTTANGDVQVAGTASFTRSDGSTGDVADASFLTGSQSSTQEVERVAANSNTIALAAAVAAAGFAATSAAASAPAIQDDGEAATVKAMDGRQVMPGIDAYEQGSSGFAAFSAAHGGGFESGLQALASSSHTAIAATHVGELTSLSIGSGPMALLEATDLSAAMQAAMPTAGMKVAMAAVSEAMAPVQAGVEGQSASAIEQIIADALNGGGSAPSIDALLSALPGQGLGDDAGLNGLATQIGTDVPNGDMGHGGVFTFDAAAIITNEAMVLHHDAVQPVANG